MTLSNIILWVSDNTFTIYGAPEKVLYKTKNIEELKTFLKQAESVYIISDDLKIDYSKVEIKNWIDHIKLKIYTPYLIKTKKFYNVLKIKHFLKIEQKNIKGVFAYSHILLFLTLQNKKLNNQWNVVLQRNHLIVAKDDLILFEIKQFKTDKIKEILEYLYRFGFDDSQKIKIFSDQTISEKKYQESFKKTKIPPFPFDLFKALKDKDFLLTYNLIKTKASLFKVIKECFTIALLPLLIYPLITYSAPKIIREDTDRDLHQFLKVIVKLEETFNKKGLCTKINYKPKKFELILDNKVKDFLNPELFTVTQINLDDIKVKAHESNNNIILQFETK